MTAKKKIAISRKKLKICRRIYLHLERRILLGKELFDNGEIVSQADRYGLDFLQQTFDFDITKVKSNSDLNAFLTEVRRATQMLLNKKKSK